LHQRGFAAWKADVLRLAPHAEELFKSVTCFELTAFTTYQHVWMRSWHDNHVLYLGDAAHAMSPHLGQGINLALIDGWTFATILEQSADFREAFRRHTRARRRHNRLYSIVTFLLTPFFQSAGFIKGLGRDIALPLMTWIPPIRRQMVLTMAGLKSGFFGGRWSLGPPD
jgi:2-polyprenyl-6-methoxyphenol hydroxylase-like FAD-dependent oxidoreductase